MERINKKHVTQFEDFAEYLGYAIVFIYEIEKGETTPKNISARAQKRIEGEAHNAMMGDIYVNIGTQGGNTAYPEGTPIKLINAIQAEGLKILSGE